MSDLPRPVVDAILMPTWTTGDPSRGVGLVRALLDAKVLVLMDDHMEVVRDRDRVEWEGADAECCCEEACEERDRARAEAARLRTALEGLLEATLPPPHHRPPEWWGARDAARAALELEAT